jgi:Tfp pilus assembly protein PilX
MHTLPSAKRQQGAVLLISLLVLLVLTLIGLSSLDGSMMEEKMASNAQTATNTFQEAESAIRQTYYQESQSPAAAVDKALNGTAAERHRDYSTADITSNTDLVYPTITGKTPLYNSSSGFTAHGIEITGNASVGHIQSRNTQGYRVFPMPSM